MSAKLKIDRSSMADLGDRWRSLCFAVQNPCKELVEGLWVVSVDTQIANRSQSAFPSPLSGQDFCVNSQVNMMSCMRHDEASPSLITLLFELLDDLFAATEVHPIVLAVDEGDGQRFGQWVDAVDHGYACPGAWS